MCALRLLRFMFLMLWLLPSASKTSKNHDNLDDFSAVDQFSDSYARETCAGPERKGLPHKNEVLNALCGEMASIGRWFESEYKIAVQATDNEDREAAQHNLVERANIRVQEIQTLMAIARCFGHEKMKGKMKKDTNRGNTRTGKAEEKACSEAHELQDTLRAMHAQSLGLSTPRVLDLGPFLNIDEIFREMVAVNGDLAFEYETTEATLSNIIEDRRRKVLLRAMLKDADLSQYQKTKSRILGIEDL